MTCNAQSLTWTQQEDSDFPFQILNLDPDGLATTEEEGDKERLETAVGVMTWAYWAWSGQLPLPSSRGSTGPTNR